MVDGWVGVLEVLVFCDLGFIAKQETRIGISAFFLRVTLI